MNSKTVEGHATPDYTALHHTASHHKVIYDYLFCLKVVYDYYHCYHHYKCCFLLLYSNHNHQN